MSASTTPVTLVHSTAAICSPTTKTTQAIDFLSVGLFSSTEPCLEESAAEYVACDTKPCLEESAAEFVACDTFAEKVQETLPHPTQLSTERRSK